MLRPMSAVGLALAVATLVVFAPFLAPLVLAAWFADLFGPATRRLERMLGGRRRAAGLLIALVAVGVLVPLAGIAVMLGSGVGDLLQQVRAALEGRGSLVGALLGGSEDRPMDLRDWAGLASRYGANAWYALGTRRARVPERGGRRIDLHRRALHLHRGRQACVRLVRSTPPAPSRRPGPDDETPFSRRGGASSSRWEGRRSSRARSRPCVYLALGIPRALVLGTAHRGLCARSLRGNGDRRGSRSRSASRCAATTRARPSSVSSASVC